MPEVIVETNGARFFSDGQTPLEVHTPAGPLRFMPDPTDPAYVVVDFGGVKLRLNREVAVQSTLEDELPRLRELLIHAMEHGFGGRDELVYIGVTEPPYPFPGMIWIDISDFASGETHFAQSVTSQNIGV